jgi:hypothetical protein
MPESFFLQCLHLAFDTPSTSTGLKSLHQLLMFKITPSLGSWEPTAGPDCRDVKDTEISSVSAGLMEFTPCPCVVHSGNQSSALRSHAPGNQSEGSQPNPNPAHLLQVRILTYCVDCREPIRSEIIANDALWLDPRLGFFWKTNLLR